MEVPASTWAPVVRPRRARIESSQALHCIGHRNCFALEAGEAISVGAHRGERHLHGHLPLQVDVASPIDFAHSAFAELAEHSVWPERITWLTQLPSRLPRCRWRPTSTPR
jgi:hypothetical protein